MSLDEICARDALVREGIAEAWAEWLHQNALAVGDLIEAATKEAVTEWLDRNGAQVLGGTP